MSSGAGPGAAPWQGSRRAKKTITTLVTLTIQNGMQGLDALNRSWREACYDLKGTADEPSTHLQQVAQHLGA